MSTVDCCECGCRLQLAEHGSIVCDGQVWCLACRQYDAALTANRDLAELQTWAGAICAAFGQADVALLENPEARQNWRLYWHGDVCRLAEAYYDHRAVLLYPPGQRLTTLCHELAHLFTGQDHTRDWAAAFARLVAWVKERLT